jgi:hypothetical protein
MNLKINARLKTTAVVARNMNFFAQFRDHDI